MTLSPGVRFGGYEILAPLGRGGMGEVWRARDTRLGREVALKTLPPEFSASQDRLSRFEREARVLASLNHPNVGGIHGLEEADGTTALVLELVEGDTLDDRLRHGALPVEEALRLAVQICAALEAAHDKGIVHRDLKPANIKITPEGALKVLDFGLAKAFEERAETSAVLSNSPTLSLAATRAGVILGTAAYMSPEQASGGASDKRADVWSFGVVLFEMLTGRRLFEGETVSHVLAAVLAKEPAWDRLPANLHPRLRELLERCLARKAPDRYRDIGDVRADLERVMRAGGVVPAPGAASPVTTSGKRVAAVAAAAAGLGAAAVALTGWMLWPQSKPGPVMRFAVPLADGQAFSSAVMSMITASPDGSRLAYLAANQLWARDLGEPEPRALASTPPGSLALTTPAFSPDGQWVAFVTVESLNKFVVKRVPMTGGTPVTLYDSAGSGFVRGLSWPDPDWLLLSNAEGIVRLPANGGARQVLVKAREQEVFDTPQLLPGENAVLFTRAEGGAADINAFGGATEIVVQSIGGDDRRVVWQGGGDARYLAATGHLIYAQGTTLFAVPFDARARAIRGSAVPIVDGVRRGDGGGSATANYAVSSTGSLVMIPAIATAPAGQPPRNTLVWVDRNGRETPLPVRADDYTAARISPDGTKVALAVGFAFQRTQRPPAIWILDLATQNLSLLASEAPRDGPVWSPDGRRLFVRAFKGTAAVGVQAIEVQTGETTTVLAASPEAPFPMPWAVVPGQQTLALVNGQNLAEMNISTVALTPGSTLTQLLHTPRHENEPSFSPDGRWMAYLDAAVLNSPSEINIRPFPDVTRTRIPVGPGSLPVFSRDGSELFIFTGNGLSTVPIAYQPSFKVGSPRELFRGDYVYAVVGRAWDVDPSGRRFLMLKRQQVTPTERGPAPPRPQINVIVNWVEELKARVPVN